MDERTRKVAYVLWKTKRGMEKHEAEEQWEEGKRLYKKISRNASAAAIACYQNGKELFEDAQLLYDHKRYARATSLAILSSEEFAKTIIINQSRQSKMIEKQTYNSLRDHIIKHEKILSIFNIIVNHFQGATIPDSCLSESMEINDLRNSSLYVLFQKNLEQKSAPSHITQEVAKQQIYRAERVMEFAQTFGARS